MPNLKNAKKALRQAQKRTERNLLVKTAYKKAVKEVQKAVEAGSPDASEQLRLAQKKLDKAAKRGILKKNTASRKLSRLSKKVRGAVAKK